MTAQWANSDLPKSACSLFSAIRLYWNIVCPLVCIVYDCFCLTTAELNSCTKDCLAHKAYTIYFPSLYRKGLLNPTIDEKTGFERL